LHWHGNGMLWPLGALALSSTKNLNGSSSSCDQTPFNRCVRPALKMLHLCKTPHPPTPLQAVRHQPLNRRHNWPHNLALCRFRQIPL